MKTKLARVAIAILALARPSTSADETVKPPGPTVGMPARVEGLVLPGPELQAKPLEDRRTPVVLRVTEVYKHGDGFRYDLSYYGLEPGTFDLGDYLRRKDGTAAADLPEIPVTIRPILPPGQIEPHPLTPSASPALGGYRWWLALGGAAWVAGLVGILFYGRRKMAPGPDGGPRRPTLADRLRPLVEAARQGKLTEGQHAELERMLIGYWRHRLDLDRADPAEAMAVMRKDERAGPLLNQLEIWLHRPGGAAAPVDVAALLEPYRDLPAEPPLAASATPGHAP